MTSTIYQTGLLSLLLIDAISATQLTGIDGLKQKEQHPDNIHGNMASMAAEAGAVHLAAVPLVRSEPKQKAVIPLDGVMPVEVAEAQEALDKTMHEKIQTIPQQSPRGSNAWEEAKKRTEAAQAKARSHSEAPPPKAEAPKVVDNVKPPATSRDADNVAKHIASAPAEDNPKADKVAQNSKHEAAAKAQTEDEKMEDAIIADPTGRTVAQDAVDAAPTENVDAASKRDQAKETQGTQPGISEMPHQQKQPTDATTSDVAKSPSSPPGTVAVHDVASASSQAPELPDRQPPQTPSATDPSSFNPESIEANSRVPALHPPDVQGRPDLPEQEVGHTNTDMDASSVAKPAGPRWMPPPEIRDIRDIKDPQEKASICANFDCPSYGQDDCSLSSCCQWNSGICEAPQANIYAPSPDTAKDVALRLREKALRLKAMGERLRKLSQDADRESKRAEDAYEAEENAMNTRPSHSFPADSQGEPTRMASPEDTMDYPPDVGVHRQTDEERRMEKRVRTGNLVMLGCALLLPVTALVIAVHIFGRKPQRNESSLQATFSTAQLDAAIANQVAAMGAQRPISPEPSPYRAAPPEAPCGRRISRPWGAVRTPSTQLDSDVGVVH